VRSGSYACVAGTAPIAEGGGVAAPGDVYAQSVRCPEIAEQALQEAGAPLADVVRTRVMLTNIGAMAGRSPCPRGAICSVVSYKSEYLPVINQARVGVFGNHKPADTLIGVARLARPEFLVEVDAIAVK
jgi:enamine deaminase RidA (YjgF/YER057c/UK114 family)